MDKHKRMCLNGMIICGILLIIAIFILISEIRKEYKGFDSYGEVFSKLK